MTYSDSDLNTLFSRLNFFDRWLYFYEKRPKDKTRGECRGKVAYLSTLISYPPYVNVNVPKTWTCFIEKVEG